jgi:hypothetical protein
MLHERLADIAAPSYVDPLPLLDRDIRYCDTLYLGYEDGILRGFYLVKWEELNCPGGPRPGVFLGLSAVAQESKGGGLIRTVYGEWLMELLAVQEHAEQEVVCWSTTASPTVYLAAYKHLRDTEPDPEGRYTAAGHSLVQWLKQWRSDWGWRRCASSEHPFLLRGASSVRYSQQEKRRIVRVSRSFSLFDRLGVQEEHGDRVIFIAKSPIMGEHMAGRAGSQPVFSP